MSIAIGLEEQARKHSVEVLLNYLADVHTLYFKTHGFHWNVTGQQFHALHAFFEEQYQALFEFVDEIAERIRALGAWAPLAASELKARSSLQEMAPGKVPDAVSMLTLLRDDHEALCRRLRTGIDSVEDGGDQATADFLTEQLSQHEKMAWMLRSHLV